MYAIPTAIFKRKLTPTANALPILLLLESASRKCSAFRAHNLPQRPLLLCNGPDRLTIEQTIIDVIPDSNEYRSCSVVPLPTSDSRSVAWYDDALLGYTSSHKNHRSSRGEAGSASRDRCHPSGANLGSSQWV